MKNTLLLIGLTALSVLYLLEVDYSALSWLNAAAFVIIALTLIPLLVRMAVGIGKRLKERRQKKQENHSGETEE